MQLKPIGQQVVVVVGASSGIGRATALQFARRGAKVVVTARDEQGLRRLVEEIQQRGGEATAVPTDVAEFAQVKALADQAAATYGRIDTWIHAAAVALYASFDQTTPEEFVQVININLLGQAYGAMAALPHLKREGRGSLIHVSSVEAKRALPWHSAYAASKHGIDGFIEALRVELRHDGWPINVAQIMPGSINTPLFSQARTKIGVKPMGVPPIYQPSIVADAILHAAEHQVRDVVVGGAAMAMIGTQRLSPRLLDRLIEPTGFTLQRTDEPKSEQAPNNLFAPMAGYDQVEGDFSDQARERSYATWLATHPLGRWGALAGAALGAVAVRSVRSARARS